MNIMAQGVSQSAIGLLCVELLCNSALTLLTIITSLFSIGWNFLATYYIRNQADKIYLLFVFGAAICLVRTIIVAVFIKETTGLTDLEKKSLYAKS